MEYIYDIVGVGFGPSNMSLAIAIEEYNHNQDKKISSIFLEKKDKFVWHGEMLLDNSTMQVHYLKDLVTIRNPNSSYTFLNYLKQHNRLEEFINLNDPYPTRIEFNDYLEWVSNSLNIPINFNSHVTDIQEKTIDNEKVYKLVLNKGLKEILARNVVIATGGTPRIPKNIKIKNGEGIFHSSEFLLKIKKFKRNISANYNFHVIGSGQSSAEIFNYLYNNFKKSTVCANLKKFNYKVADDSPLVNQVFFSNMVDKFYSLDEKTKEMFLKDIQQTNYSAVDLTLINEIYKDLYQQKLRNEDRFTINNLKVLISAEEKDHFVICEYKDLYTNEITKEYVDALVMATGYERNINKLLQKFTESFLLNEKNEVVIDRSYRIIRKEHTNSNIYLQGFTESTHGISDTLLSNLAIKSGEILNDITIHLNKKSRCLNVTP